MSRVICQTNWNTRVYVVFQSIISHGWQATGSQSPLLVSTVQAGQYGESFYTSRSYPGTVLGDTWGGCMLLLGDVGSIRGGGGWMAASRCVRCMQCLCWGFVLGRRGRLSRRSSIQVDEISCIRDHPRILLSELQVMIPKVERNGVCI